MKKFILLINIFISLTQISFAQETTIPINDIDGLKDMVSGNSYILMKDLILPIEWKSKDLENFQFDGNNHCITFLEGTDLNTIVSEWPSLFNEISNNSVVHNLKLLYPQKFEKEIANAIDFGSIAIFANDSEIRECIVVKNEMLFNIPNRLTIYAGGLVTETKNTEIHESTFISKEATINGYNNNINFIFGGILGITNNKNLIHHNLCINSTFNEINIGGRSIINTGGILPTETPENNGVITNISDIEIQNYILPNKNKFINISENTHISLPYTVTASLDHTTIILNNNQENSRVTIIGEGVVFFSGNTISVLELNANIKQTGIVNCVKKVILHDGCTIGISGINNKGEILYLREPSVWTGREGNGGDGTGWETIYLPFDAELITVDNDGKKDITNSNDHDPAHVPFGNKGATYWLKQFDGTETNTDGEMRAIFTQSTAITKNMPYIISIPGGGGWTGTKYDFTKKVIGFKGTGVVNNTHVQIQQGNFIFENHPLDSKTESNGRYFINSFGEYPEVGSGDQFIARENGTLLPFRASIIENSTSARAPYLRIAFDYNNATSITPSFEDETENLNVYTFAGEIVIETKEPKRIAVYSASTGMVCRTIDLVSGRNTVQNLQKGIYIIEGKKVVL